MIKKFQKIEKKVNTQTPIFNKCIETTQLSGMKLGVFHNDTNYTAQVEFAFNDIQEGWQSQEVKLTNNLYQMNNIAYKMPVEFSFADKWYEHAIQKGRAFTKLTKSNYHTKLGYRFDNRYYTIPYTWFSYDPNTNLALLQVTIPDVNEHEFTNHVELEMELDMIGAKGLHYAYAG